MPTVRLIALLLISLLGLVACASPGVEPRPAQPSPSAATVASSDASPTPSSSSIPAADVAKAVALRRSYGLRTDLEWIGRVMADPAADTSFGTAMTAQEVEELFARTARSEEIRGTMQAYGEAHRDEWGGLFVEQATGGTIVGLFTAHLENHRAALAATLRSPVRWDVREVRWPERDLLALQERIVADASWLESIDSPFQAAGVDTVRNVVMVAVSSARADITALVIDHFNAPGMIEVTSDGLGPWKGGYGTLVVRAIDGRGRPVTGLDCTPVPDRANAWSNGDLIGYGTDDRGECRIQRLGATGCKVELRRLGDAGAPVVVGSARALVARDRTTRITIVVSS